MILPNGKNKKYIEIVSNLYILYIILNPILNLDKNFEFINIKDTIANISNSSYVSQDELAKTYILGLENALKQKIENEGYFVDYIQFWVTNDFKNISKIDVKMKYETQFEIDEIKNIVLKDFEIDKSNIKVF